MPILHRYLLLGDDAFFESLCNLVQRISSPAAVPSFRDCLGDGRLASISRHRSYRVKTSSSGAGSRGLRNTRVFAK